MGALPQDAAQAVDVVAALQAGVDLLLATPDRRGPAADRGGAPCGRRRSGSSTPTRGSRRPARSTRSAAGSAGSSPPRSTSSAARSTAPWRGSSRERSVTLVRDGGSAARCGSAPERSILAVMPAPRDLTPADTSSYVAPALAAALRTHHPKVEEIVDLASADRRGDRRRPRDARPRPTSSSWARSRRLAGSPQAALVEAVLATGRPLVTVALRTPWDLAAYPAAATHLCTYSILPASMDALAAALFGAARVRAAGCR